MSEKVEIQGRDGRRSGSSSTRSTRANSVASEDNSSADTRSGTVGSSSSLKKCSSAVSSTTSGRESSSEIGGGSRDRLRYSYEFLKKLQKSKLSRKPPECMPKLRQENILRETWRNDKDDKRDNGDREVQIDLGMTRRSFVAGCQIANIQLSEGTPKSTSKLLGHQAGGKECTQGTGQSNSNGNSSSGGKDSNGATAAAINRRIGSGRLDRFKDTRSDRDRDYGYGSNDRDPVRRRGAFDFRNPRDMKGRRYDMGREDEPEWYTEGPTSQTDTIELGGFDDARSGMPRDISGNGRTANSSQSQATTAGRDKRQSANANKNRMTPSPDPERRKKSWSEKEILQEFTSADSNNGPKRETPSSHDNDDNDHDEPSKRTENFDANGDNSSSSSSQEEVAAEPISFVNFFLNSGEESQAELQPDDQRQSSAMLGSRFMSKVFSKAPMPTAPQPAESPRHSPTPDQPREHEPSEPQHHPIMELLRAATPQEVAPPPPAAVGPSPGGGGPPAFLRDLMHMPPHHPPGGGGDMVPVPPGPVHMIGSPHPQAPHHPNNALGNMIPIGPSHGAGPLDALLGGPHRMPLHPGQPPMHHHHHHPHGMPPPMPPMPPSHGPPMEHMNSNGNIDKPNCDNGRTSGRELIELLLMNASVSGAPSPPPPPPQHAKTVEELEAEMKLQSSRPMMHPPVQQPHLNHGGPHGGPGMPMERAIHGGMPHHPPPMDRPLNGMMPLVGDMGPHGPPMSMGPMGHHFPPAPPHMGVSPHPAAQANLTAGQDIMRLLIGEGQGRGDGGHGRALEPAHTKPAFKQDLKNVPTQVLLREKDLVIQREPNSGPRPIVKSNKSNTPPAPPSSVPAPQPHENGAEFLSKMLQQRQQQQQQPPPRPHHAGGPYFGGNGPQSGGTGNAKIIRGGNPPAIAPHQNQQSLVLEELFASAGQASQQQDGRLVLGPPTLPRPLTGMHGHRYGEMGQYGPPPPPPPMQPAHQPMKSQNVSGNNGGLQSHNPFAKWFGEGFPAEDSPALPRNVVRVEDLERQQQRFHQKLPVTVDGCL